MVYSKVKGREHSVLLGGISKVKGREHSVLLNQSEWKEANAVLLVGVSKGACDYFGVLLST